MAQKAYGTITITDTNDIESIVIEYAQNQDPSNAPSSGWSTNRPDWAENYYIWQRTRIHKAGTPVSSDTYGTAVCITGSTGSPGAAGRGIIDVETLYATNNNTSTAPTSGWQVQPPTYDSSKPKYWVKITTTYSSGDPDIVTYLDNGITDAIKTSHDANTTANEAKGLSEQTHVDVVNLQTRTKHFWRNLVAHTNGVSGWTKPNYPIGTYAASGISGTTFDEEDSSTYGYNTLYSNGIKLRYNAINLGELNGTSLTFYNPSTTSQGTKAMELTGSALKFYASNGSTVQAEFGGTKARVSGTIEALDGQIGNNANNYWYIGNYVDYNQNQSAAIKSYGTAFIQLGNSNTWRIATNRFHSAWNDDSSGTSGQLHYPVYDSKYWDSGLHLPTSLTDKFLYIRNAPNTQTLENLQNDLEDSGYDYWTYRFYISADGSLYARNLYVLDDNGNTTQIGGTDGVYLLKSGGTITGNLTVNGTTSITKASVNSNLAKLDTGSANAVDTMVFITGNAGADNSNYYKRPASYIWNWIKGKTDLLYLPFTGGTITGPLSVNDEFDADSVTAGNLIVTGVGRFTNGIYGNLTGNVTGNITGNAATADKVNHDLIIKLNGGSTEGTNKFTFNGSAAKTVDVTKSAIGLGNVENKSSATIRGELTSSDVTDALGFTPYNATNPNGYASGTVTSVKVQGSNGLTGSGTVTTSGTITISHADTSSQASSSNSGRTYIQSITLDDYGHVTELTTATETVTNSDTKVSTAAVTSGTTYYPVVGADTTSAATKFYDKTGITYTGTNGTANGTNGAAVLTLGNSTASTAANWKAGKIVLYGTTTYATTIVSGAPTAARTITLPNKTGTVALTSDSLKNPNALTLNLFNETAERTSENQGTATSSVSYDGGTANQNFNAAGTNAITNISASAASGGATTFTLIKANGAKSTFEVTVTASVATGATTLTNSGGTPISTTGNTTPVYFDAGVPKDVTGIAYSLLPTGTSANTVAIGNHTHTISLASDTGTTGVVSLSHGGKYKLTAGGQSVIFTLPSDNNTDTKVKLTSQATSGTYPLMFGPTSITSGSAYEVYYNTGISVNPSTKTITATTFSGNATSATNDSDNNAINTTYLKKSGGTMTGRLTTAKPINQIITGTGTAGSDKGASVSPRYIPAKWTFNTGMTLTDGDIITIKIPVAGHTAGVYLSIDNGTTYKPIATNSTSRLTTHYAVNNYITLIYESSGSIATYAINGADTTSTITGGVWRVINYYDSNSNTIPQAYCGTGATTAAKTASMDYYVATAKTWVMIDIRYANTVAGAITMNINGQGAKPIYINGTASSASNYTLPAGSHLVYYDGTNYYFRTDGKITGDITGNSSTTTAFSSNAAITLTGDTTGTASSTKGWSIATTTKKITATDASTSNLNELTNLNTEYYFGGGSNTATNGPVTVGTAFGLRLWKTAAGYVRQEFATNGGTLYYRTYGANAWADWRAYLDSSNYTNYTVTKTGTGASGTWGISISGMAATATNVTGTLSQSPNDGYRHVWFSWKDTETKRAYTETFTYCPADDKLKVGSTRLKDWDISEDTTTKALVFKFVG